MSKLLDEVKKAGVFYIATADGNTPHVRPFGAIEEINGKIYLVTGNKKDVFRQFVANPKVEFVGSYDDGSWIRVSGNVKRTFDVELKKKYLELRPTLQKIYSADDGIFEVFELADAKGEIHSGAEVTKIED
ncbi:pyridoxamine 5'-phosphate oxidase family protein [Treponema sp.]|uniref:pyridoxamine 5'-phosphate oxidase family protein n=1 Tax=Treponema sp. TaxID=166 RepID=UPI00388DCBE1